MAVRRPRTCNVISAGAHGEPGDENHLQSNAARHWARHADLNVTEEKAIV